MSQWNYSTINWSWGLNLSFKESLFSFYLNFKPVKMWYCDFIVLIVFSLVSLFILRVSTFHLNLYSIHIWQEQFHCFFFNISQRLSQNLTWLKEWTSLQAPPLTNALWCLIGHTVADTPTQLFEGDFFLKSGLGLGSFYDQIIL